MPSRRDRGKMSFGLSCHPEPGLERCWPSFSSALWWWQPQQGWPRFSLCTSRGPRTGHRGQTEVRRFAFGILHPLPIPMGCWRPKGQQAFSPLSHGAGDGLQSSSDPSRKSASPVCILAVTGCPPLLHTLKETSRSVHSSRPSTSPGHHQCGCRSSPRRLPAVRARACPGRQSCTWPRPCR